VDDQRVGRVLRALRRRRGWRQLDLARAAGCSQATVSETERGDLPSVPIVRRLLTAVDAQLVINVWWRAGELDRLLDSDHADLIALVSRLLGAAGWELRVEVTYNVYGERGSIDVLAFGPLTGTLLVLEIKTDIAAVEQTLRKIDEKVRLSRAIAQERFDWHVKQVGWLLVMPETSTLRRKIGAHASLFDRAFPVRGAAIRSWIKRPSGAIAGLWFLSGIAQRSGVRGAGGRTRMRKAKSPPDTASRNM
jgi:transcriptional regulator with XRE-family HTH domain